MASKARNHNLLITYSCLVLLTLQTSFAEADKLLQNQQLSDLDEPLVSASGKFMLGFFSPRFSTDKYLGIWYNRPTKESGYYQPPVWVANRNTPILHNESASLTIDSNDGNLKIIREGGNPIAVSSIQEGGNITRATLLQSGNFVLQEMNSDGSVGRVLWQSFDYPTDTLLPGMKIGIDLQTGHKWFLQSWIADDSPAPGPFTLGLDSNSGNQLIIQSTEGKDYWKSGILVNGHFNFSDSESINQDYNFSYISDEKEQYFSYSANQVVISSFPMLKIDPDGGLTGHHFTIGPCGLYQDCDQDHELPCGRDIFDFKVQYGNMSGQGFRFRESDNMTLNECRFKCAENCSCVACAPTNSVTNTGCELWCKGAKFEKISDPNFVRPIYIFEPKTENKQWRAFVIVGALLVLLLCIFCCLMWRKYKEKAEGRMDQQNLLHELGDSLSNFFVKRTTKEKDQNMKHELKGFNFQTIAAATNNFSTTNKLGEGGFGPVYKGTLQDGQVIAVKRLSGRTSQGIVEFKNEAKVIAKLQHTNLVRLIGCSLHGAERILVYEFMPNKSLDFFIFDSVKKKLLTWSKRISIIEGIAQGLIYLHKYSRLRVIHRDLKASNILLDDHLNPKISDFGMARIFEMNESKVNTNRVVGTYGYMAPEYAMNGIVSMKADVFSFGVLLLEIVIGRKNNSCYDEERPLNLVGYAWQLWNEGKALELVEAALDGPCPENEVLRCIHVGLLCVQDQAVDRPTMADVVSMLRNESEFLSAPKQPAFFISVAAEEQQGSENKSENHCSINDLTISAMKAR